MEDGVVEITEEEEEADEKEEDGKVEIQGQRKSQTLNEHLVCTSGIQGMDPRFRLWVVLRHVVKLVVLTCPLLQHRCHDSTS